MKNLVKIRYSKLQLWFNDAKEIRSAKYVDYIRHFYNDLYRCQFAFSHRYYAEGLDKVLYCRKTDVDAVLKKYRDNLPKNKNWDKFFEADYSVTRNFVWCDDYEVSALDMMLGKGENDEK